ncbi:hypothetical protein QC761_600180 [Podospora bellae-mahoneyi]|uniref:WD repeat-containing protein 79 n=1 Tax=Podospora bellae-mahoneyi TaxID=2093777 RepID=A0ABR0FCR9_9PEZI|nr:hypothetical protein QC761_600180 [Podospora bellae-mahoneyi]
MSTEPNKNSPTHKLPTHPSKERTPEIQPPTTNKPSLNLLTSTTCPTTCPPKSPDPRNRDTPFFKSAQWTADGTTLLTLTSHPSIQTYVLPSTLLTPPHPFLTPTSTLPLPEPTSTFSPSPYFSLSHPSTHYLLTATTDHPIHLNPIFSPASPPLASFFLIKPETESYLPITSLIWPSPGTHFITGTTNLLALFDISRPDSLCSTPLLKIPTIPSTRHISKGNGIGMRGTVSALGLQPTGAGEGILAAGTWTRWVGLYDIYRSGSVIANFSVKPSADHEAGVKGKGVVQTIWSPCGRYLVVNERGSEGLLVYDVRGTHKLLGWLSGRDGTTNQRLGVDVFPDQNGNGFEVWAGRKNGTVVMYEGVGMNEEETKPTWEWGVNDGESAVGATAMHSSGSVLATCSGSWKVADGDSSDEGSSDDSDSDSEDDSSSGKKPAFVVEETSLKVWSIDASNGAAAQEFEPLEGDVEEKE